VKNYPRLNFMHLASAATTYVPCFLPRAKLSLKIYCCYCVRC